MTDYQEYLAFCKENKMLPASEYEFYYFSKLFKFFTRKT